MIKKYKLGIVVLTTLTITTAGLIEAATDQSAATVEAWPMRQRNWFQATDTVPPPPTTLPLPEHYDIWLRLAVCESGSRWSYNGSSGYDGGLQFLPSTWTAMGGGRFAPYAWQASMIEQMTIAELTLDEQGWEAWPDCSRKLGLR